MDSIRSHRIEISYNILYKLTHSHIKSFSYFCENALLEESQSHSFMYHLWLLYFMVSE